MHSSLLLIVLATLLNIVSVYGQAPVVTIDHSDPQANNKWYITAERDQDVVMDCHVENLDPHTVVRWDRTYRKKNSNNTWGILSLSKDLALEDNIHYSIEKPRDFTWRLRIRFIQVSDEGTYQCYVLTNQDSRAADHRIITVVYQPFFDLQRTSSDTRVDAGESVELLCNAGARPPATIEWTRLGGALLPIGQEKKLGSVLSIPEIKPEDRGIYRCTAVNSVRNTIKDINVEVDFAPVVSVNKKTVYQAVGYRIELQCFGEGNPVPQERDSFWTRGDEGAFLSKSSDEYEQRFLQGAFGQVTYELIFLNVQESSYGKYVCNLRNSKGDGTNEIILEKADEPQKSIKLGRIIAAASMQSISLLLFLAAVMLSLTSRTLLL